MKAGNLSSLAKRIRQELVELDHVIVRINEGWQYASRSDDNFYLDSVALNLHGFYSGLERIFSLIAETIDGSLPQGENWHTLLLEQMTKEIAHIRPAVISTDIGARLQEYRGFRHVVRNVYAYQFDSEKVGKLVVSAPALFAQAKKEITAFASFLERN